MSVSPRWLSTCELPCPGKCFSEATNPEPCKASIQIRACSVTTAVSAEKLRPKAPITGHRGLTFTSTHGAKSTLTPACRHIRAVCSAHLRVVSGWFRAP